MEALDALPRVVRWTSADIDSNPWGSSALVCRFHHSGATSHIAVQPKGEVPDISFDEMKLVR